MATLRHSLVNDETVKEKKNPLGTQKKKDSAIYKENKNLWQDRIQ